MFDPEGNDFELWYFHPGPDCHPRLDPDRAAPAVSTRTVSDHSKAGAVATPGVKEGAWRRRLVGGSALVALPKGADHGSPRGHLKGSEAASGERRLFGPRFLPCRPFPRVRGGRGPPGGCQT